jgi:hypothetical protein
VPEAKPIAWRSIGYGTIVITSDSVRVGVVHEVLGSDTEDIFHGLLVRLTTRREDVMVAAADIESMSLVLVRAALTQSQFEALPAYDETVTRHLASVGWLRDHLRGR